MRTGPEGNGAPGAVSARGNRRRRLPRAVWPVLASLVLIGVLVVGVFPTRTWLAQRAAIARSQERLSVLEEENALLGQRVVALSSQSEIERIAREQYLMIRPGEQAFAVLPAAKVHHPLPPGWFFDLIRG